MEPPLMDDPVLSLLIARIRPHFAGGTVLLDQNDPDGPHPSLEFARIFNRPSFSAAAADLGVSRPVATAAIKALEWRLGTRLLQRSTRHVQPTVEGRAYYRRCMAILADIENADRSASGAVAGLLRSDVVGHLARTVLLPALPAFLAQHPALIVHLGEDERFVDLVREGVDCVVRTGQVAGSDMVVRRLGAME